MLVNNEEAAWEGEVVLDEPTGKGYRVEEWWEEGGVNFAAEAGTLTIHARVPEFGFRIYSVGNF